MIEAVQVTKWRTDDGELHDTEEEAQVYEMKWEITRIVDAFWRYDMCSSEMVEAIFEHRAALWEALK